MANNTEPVSKEQYDLAGAIMAFEDGEMDEADFFRLFQYLIDTGLAWTMQGAYGRTAMRLIDDGLCMRPGGEA